MTPDRWPGKTVTVSVDDMHRLLAFGLVAQTVLPNILDDEDVVRINRIVEAVNTAKELTPEQLAADDEVFRELGLEL
jgi:hypothetical protein